MIIIAILLHFLSPETPAHMSINLPADISTDMPANLSTDMSADISTDMIPAPGSVSGVFLQLNDLFRFFLCPA